MPSRALSAPAAWARSTRGWRSASGLSARPLAGARAAGRRGLARGCVAARSSRRRREGRGVAAPARRGARALGPGRLAAAHRGRRDVGARCARAAAALARPRDLRGRGRGGRSGWPPSRSCRGWSSSSLSTAPRAHDPAGSASSVVGRRSACSARSGRTPVSSHRSTPARSCRRSRDRAGAPLERRHAPVGARAARDPLVAGSPASWRTVRAAPLDHGAPGGARAPCRARARRARRPRVRPAGLAPLAVAVARARRRRPARPQARRAEHENCLPERRHARGLVLLRSPRPSPRRSPARSCPGCSPSTSRGTPIPAEPQPARRQLASRRETFPAPPVTARFLLARRARRDRRASRRWAKTSRSASSCQRAPEPHRPRR